MRSSKFTRIVRGGEVETMLAATCPHEGRTSFLSLAERAVVLVLSALAFGNSQALGQNPCAPPSPCPLQTLPFNVGGTWTPPITDVIPLFTPPTSPCGPNVFNGEIAHVFLMPPHFPNGAHAYTGMVFFLTSEGCPVPTTRVWAWDPANPTAPATPLCTGSPTTWNPGSEGFFCSGHSFAPNGDLIIAGGTDVGGTNCGVAWGHRALWRFDAATALWGFLANMAHERWYASTTVLPSGSILIDGHTSHPTAAELGLPYSPSNTFEILATSPSYSLGVETLVCDPAGTASSGSGCSPGTGPPVGLDDYGWIMVTRLGQLLYAGPKSYESAGLQWKRYGNICPGGCVFPLAPATQFWPRDSQLPILPPPPSPANRSYGNPVHLFYWDKIAGVHREEVYLIGGDAGSANEASCSANTQASVDALINPAPGTPFVKRNPMAFSRRFANAVLTPTGKVIVIGGKGPSGSDCIPRLIAEIYDPLTNTWQSLNTQCHPRGYHSVALLLPNGRIVSAGGIPYTCWCPGSPTACPSPEPPGPGQPVQCYCDPNETCPPICAPLDMTAQHSLEIFEPPYLFTAAGSYAVPAAVLFSPTDTVYYSAGNPRRFFRVLRG
ncbi:MAG TPA: hypothetical protein VFI25_08065 [Planctomycetota bacterium]|jgi:hypothetical protein|nr:hypothetical protein [Planctomycetota bacterium]